MSRYRTNAVIKASSPLFCILILVGLSMAYLFVISFQSYPPTRASCAAEPVIGHLAFALVFGCLIVKTYRVARIFGQTVIQVSH
jgi:hypothetical protein